MTDYGVYRFSKREWVENIFLYGILSGCIAYLFYRSAAAFVLCLLFYGKFLKMRQAEYCRRRRRKLESQFLSAIQAVAASLRAGYSVENAFLDAAVELEKSYGEEEMIIKEFRSISTQLQMNRNLEELLDDLAQRSNAEDIRNFAEVFTAAKRTGGNLVAIMEHTAFSIAQKEETKREIETTLSAKKLEQNIMSLVPAGILFYVQLVSPGFLDGMYHNVAGVLVMSLCLAVYGAAYLWGRKIVEIEV